MTLCKRGHDAPKDSNTGWCQECRRENKRQWYWDHREVMLAGANQYNAKHAEEKNDYAKTYFKLHGRTLSKDISDYNRNALKRKAPGKITKEDIQRLLVSQNNICIGCRINIKDTYTLDHIIPLTKGGTNYSSNIQLLCLSCNCQKGNRSMEEWLAYRQHRGLDALRQ